MTIMPFRFPLLSPAILPLAAVLLLGLSGCEGVSQQLGLTRAPPDEFAIVTKAPLALPPNSNLRPPEPGAPRPQELASRENAQSVLTGRRELPGAASRSQGENALLRQAGAQHADPNIRQIVNGEYTQLAERDEDFVDRLIFWQKQPPPGQVIDPQRESARLRENQATGQSITTGATPVIERRKRAIFEGIFN